MELLLLATRCQRFGRAPSEVYGIADETVAEAFNIAAAYALQLTELKIANAREEQSQKAQWDMTKALVETWGGTLTFSKPDTPQSNSTVDRSNVVRW